MATKKKQHHEKWRACTKCGHYAPELSKAPAWDQKEYTMCPVCEQGTFRLRTHDQMSYMEWKGEIGAGRILREIVKSQES